MNSNDEHREQGVSFGGLEDDLATAEYPMKKAALLDAYGDRELELEDGTTTLREILEPIGEDTFDSPDGVIQSVIGMVDDEAIGRKDYTDRGGYTKVPDDTEESL